MKQYCKYCANSFPHGDDHCYCDVKKKVISEAAASKANKCKEFELNEMNVFDPGQIYKPRKSREDTREEDGQQLSLMEVIENG